MGMAFLTLFYALTVYGVYRYTKKKMDGFKRIGFQYEYPLDKKRFFGLICLGSFCGGFNGGTFALGNSTTIIFTLVYLGVEPIVVSATVGFQVAFSAAAAICQALIQNLIPLEVIGFFFGLSFIGGGLLSYLTLYAVSKLDHSRINKLLMGIVGSLTGISALSMVLNIVISYSNFGPEYMMSVDDFCG